MTWTDSSEEVGEYLMFSEGNNLSLRSLADPQDPVEVSRGAFGVGNNGDSDYDLLTYAMCDDCRFGVAVFQLATVFFDLGVGDYPDFTNFHKSELTGEIPPVVTFKWGGHQYLVAAGLNEYECGPEGSGLYLFNTIYPQNLQKLQCLIDDIGAPLLVKGGRLLQDDDISGGAPYFWGTDGYHFFILEVLGSGAGLELILEREITETPVIGRGTHLLGFDVDLNAGAFPGSNDGLAVTVYPTTGMKLWRISDLANPQPIIDIATPEGYTITSLAYPIVWAGAYQTTGMETTFDIDLSNPDSPQLLDDWFWGPARPWNQHPCATSQTGSTFTRDGNYLFAARYEVLQRFDFTECRVPDIPVAGVVLEHRSVSTDPWQAPPARIFPGDKLRVSSASTGTIETTEIWITDDDDPGTTVASGSGSPAAFPVEFAIPIGGSPGPEPSSGYTAHVSVTNFSGSDEVSIQAPIALDPQTDITFQATP